MESKSEEPRVRWWDSVSGGDSKGAWLSVRCSFFRGRLSQNALVSSRSKERLRFVWRHPDLWCMFKW